ncbi:hypothetical protein F4823DRAFT_15419 [Ustulina deusta]|nr:hypothetical protein F4823DRAFT_15419 [Ustulina deusta]
MPACASCVIGGIHKFFMGKSSLPAFYGGGANRLSGGVFWREPCPSKSTSRKRNQWSFVVLMLVPAPGKIHRLFMLEHRTRLVSNLADLDGLAFLMSNRWFGIFITAHTKPDANHILPCGLTRGEYGIDGLFHSRRSRTPEEGFCVFPSSFARRTKATGAMVCLQELIDANRRTLIKYRPLRMDASFILYVCAPRSSSHSMHSRLAAGSTICTTWRRLGHAVVDPLDGGQAGLRGNCSCPKTPSDVSS